LFVVRITYPYFIESGDIEVANLPMRNMNSVVEEKDPYARRSQAAQSSSQFFSFDPNTVSLKELLLLGFKEKTARTLLKFREKGFVFKEKEDLKKVYGISDGFFRKLAPYVLIPAKAEPALKENKKNTPVISEIKIVELNSADSLSLVAIKGIGPSFAKRILKYRSLLGGYVNAEQLLEVYGFTEEMYAQIRTQVSVDPALVKRINLNSDDFKTVNKHPYLSYELTKVIFDWRRKTVITAYNIETVINDEEVLKKMQPYLAY
jgi:competence protein ComEA